MQSKRCPQCGETKELTNEFWPRNSATKTGFHSWCKECSRRKKRESDERVKARDPEAFANRRKQYVETYRRKHPEVLRRGHRLRNLRKFGITEEQYDALLAAQGGRCAICELPERGRMLAVDHCHSTEEVRGLLCSKCNTGLGLFDDRQDRLMKAISYLERDGGNDR